MKCEVLQVLTHHVKVKLLDGPEKGQEHKYLFKDFTVTTTDRNPPLPPPLPPPVAEGATEPAAAVSAAASVEASAAVAPQEEDETDAFMQIFQSWVSHLLYKLVLQAYVLYRYKPWEHRQHCLLVTY